MLKFWRSDLQLSGARAVQEFSMSIPRFPSMFFVRLALSVLLSTASVAQSQTHASCTFRFFKLGVNIPNLGPGFITPSGINDFGTIVGVATPNDPLEPNAAFVRWANGGISFPLGTSSVKRSALLDRNDNGSSIGYLGSVALLLKGTTVTPVNLNNIGSPVEFIRGINNWGSIVGSYNTPSTVNGFKRWSNGNALTLSYPRSSTSTFPTSINDNGTVVGSYFSGPSGVQLPQNGFIYHNGNWATLNYPNPAAFTDLVGISNAGMIIGNADTDHGFLYKNGVFKIISAPDGSPTNVMGISPKLGLIVGTGNQGGFIAKCN